MNIFIDCIMLDDNALPLLLIESKPLLAMLCMMVDPLIHQRKLFQTKTTTVKEIPWHLFEITQQSKKCMPKGKSVFQCKHYTSKMVM